MEGKFLNFNKLTSLASKNSIEQKKRIAEEKKKREARLKKLEKEKRRREEEKKKREEEKKKREEEREKIRAQKRLERKKLMLYEKIKFSGMKTTGDMEKDIKTFLATINPSSSNLPKRKTSHTVSAIPDDKDYDFTHIKSTVETYTINKKIVPIYKGKGQGQGKDEFEDKNQSSGMAFDKFDYGLD